MQARTSTSDIVIALLNIANVFGMCIVYYPLMACISLRRHVLANVIGLLYIVPW